MTFKAIPLAKMRMRTSLVSFISGWLILAVAQLPAQESNASNSADLTAADSAAARQFDEPWLKQELARLAQICDQLELTSQAEISRRWLVPGRPDQRTLYLPENSSPASDMPPNRVGLKGKTGEHVGPVGQEEAIQAECVCLLSKTNQQS